MANNHFAEIGDLWKHLPLAELLALEHPVRYWESHAGSASYPLTHSWQRDYGAHYFLDHAQQDPALAASRYYALLTNLPAIDGYPYQYPGSPSLAMMQLGTSAEAYVFCDLDPESIGSLQDTARVFMLADRVRCVLDDGIATLWEMAETPSPDGARRTMVHIDPFEPFDAGGRSHLSATDLCCNLAARGYQVVYWYGYEEPHERGWAWNLLAPRLGDVGASLWCGEVSLRALRDPVLPPNPGIRGCGVFCANISAPVTAACARLGAGLEAIYQTAVLPGGVSGALVFEEWARP